MVNRVLLVGLVATDPDVRDSPAGPVARFTLTTTEPWRDTTRTETHRIVATGGLADQCFAELAAGLMACVEGRIRSGEIVAVRVVALERRVPTMRAEDGPPWVDFDEDEPPEPVTMNRKPKREKVQLAETLDGRADRLRKHTKE